MRIAIAALALAVAAPSFGICPHYNNVARFFTGTTPEGVAVADFNRDGHMDFVVANSGSNNITVYLGNGTASPSGFSQANYAVGVSPRAIAVGDFNGDGKPDLAVANDGSTISTLLNNGNGTFATAVTFASGASPHSIAAADLNNDGKLDLVTPNYLGANTTIYTGDGSGGFTLSNTLSGTDHPTAVVIADLNIDGKADIAVLNDATKNVAVFIAGAGTFATAVNYARPGSDMYSMTTADVNHDGKIDLVVGAHDATSVLLNDGSGAFTSGMQSIYTGKAIAAGDLKGDGTVAFVVTANPYMTVITTNKSGNEILDNVYGIFTTMGGIAVADFNDDGRPDILLVEQGLNRVGIMTAPSCVANCAAMQNAGSFGTATYPWGAATGDFNRDGKLDLAVPDNSSNTLSILLGDGAGSFGSASNIPTDADPYAAAVADFNRDGIPDVVVAGGLSAGFDFMIGDGSGGFIKNYVNDGQRLYSVAVADFDGNGYPDVVFAAPNRPGISIFYYFPVGGFSAPFRYDTTTGTFFATVGDFNGDGRPDVVTADSGGSTVTVLLKNAVNFDVPVSYAAGTSPRSIAVADFNHDGKLDLAVANNGSNDVSILIGNGLGGFAAPVNYAAAEQPVSIVAADLNGDGNPDLAVANFAGADVTILLGNSDGTFTAGSAYGTGVNPSSVVAGDFDRDGKIDLVATNAGSNNVVFLKNRCLYPELKVVKSHTGNFTQGQTGVQYTIAVDNSGTAPSSGPVAVTDALPAGLIPTAISGTGWACTLANLTCTRNDALGTPASYPPITLTATVRSNAPATITNTANITGGGDVDPDNNSSSNDATVAAASGIAPTGLVATAQSTAQINVTWDDVTGATQGYLIVRSHNGINEELGLAMTANYTDTAVGAGITYVYQAGAVTATGSVGPASNKDLATTIFFTDDPLVPTIKAAHFLELRSAVDAVRLTAGFPSPATYTYAIAPGNPVHAADLTELRTYLDQARAMIGVSALTYAEPIVAGTTTIKAAHILELRNGVK